MKEKIITFIIGLLVGAVLASGAFLIYTKTSNNNSNIQMVEPGENPPDMNNNGGTPPEKPDGDNGEEPPEKPSSNN